MIVRITPHLRRDATALLGDAKARIRAVLTRWEVIIPELDAGHGWRPLRNIGAMRREMSAIAECDAHRRKRINSISDSKGHFACTLGDRGQEIMDNNARAPIVAIPEYPRPTMGTGRRSGRRKTA